MQKGENALRYRVVLVDDEPWALKDFELSFPWAKSIFAITSAACCALMILSIRRRIPIGASA